MDRNDSEDALDLDEIYAFQQQTRAAANACLGGFRNFVPDDGNVYCNATWDTVLCWPPTLSGTDAVISCPADINGVPYDTSKNVIKYCYTNGTWLKANYTLCEPLNLTLPPLESDILRLIHVIGYSVSLVAVVVALIIFLYFKDLRCLRNTFHANLLATYFLYDLFWIISVYLKVSPEESHMVPCVMMVLLYYFHGTNFFWMLVEGFYLYMLVVHTFTVDKVRFYVYMFLGWGMPAIVVTFWAIVKAKIRGISPEIGVTNDDVEEITPVSCPWLEKDAYGWIFNAPILLVLLVNMVFLGKIMWVLITKLRAAATAESQQYRKAAKALLVLIPLLGVPYIILLVAPTQGLIATVVEFTRAIALSTQGFTISVIYCFLNGEVRNTLRHHMARLKVSNCLKGTPRFSSRYRDGSPRSGTESIRICSMVTAECRCDTIAHTKESCISCLTNSQSLVKNGNSADLTSRLNKENSASRLNPQSDCCGTKAVGIEL